MGKLEIFYGDNLRLARLMAGISLNEIGERVGTTRQYIHKLETTDKKSPTDLLVKALAFELNVEPNFFSLPIGNQVKEEECHFRKLKSTLVSSRRECTARATLLNRLIDTLEEYLTLPEINFPHHEVSSLFDIEQTAMSYRKLWSLGDGPIKNMVRVVENAGAIVSTFGNVSEKVDALSIHRNRPIILLNPTKSAARIRMDIGHEAAHIILHKGIETGDKETENQANHFASVFLLPQQALLQEYTSRSQTRLDWNSISSIKIKWGISSKAIIYRLHQNGIISPSLYRRANIHFSKTGQTKNEYYDDQVPNNLPELLPTSIELLGKSYGSSFGGLLKELSIKPNFLSELTQTKDIIDLLMVEDNLSGKVTSINAYKRSIQD